MSASYYYQKTIQVFYFIAAVVRRYKMSVDYCYKLVSQIYYFFAVSVCINLDLWLSVCEI